MRIARQISSLAVTACLTFASAPALADAITLGAGDVGSSYDFAFDGYSGGTTVTGLTSTAKLTLTGVTSNSYTFSYSLTNTTSDPVNSRLSGFAFNTDPNISSASSTGAFSYTTVGGSYPNGIGSVDVCFKAASTGACAGGGSGGLLDGQNGTGSFTLNFAQPLTSLTLSDFFVRYQSITGAGNITSGSGTGTLTTSGGSTSTGGTPVPEPGMVGLLGAALAGVAFARRRRCQQQLALA
ncbi:cistern family PEP-CTERM protein [Novosphingobium ginsenosidimutans]|uniref:PEP-CTERM sorting domain-containing protein n=1 Tax=Novosphingobium ginsenosidimutans TaxID=1176536 RepID=A0A5B8S9B4_9SPHN|nr:cistern family PEP-CTERM protein [Novosphingobium ginsenosidimutans]QEA17137.1 PEP-CTERM sorting domain-containing protein [Novosphingobium ginsenosidimutans]